jgi:hypothetical protein
MVRISKQLLQLLCASSGRPGISPIGNPIESYNRWGLKRNQIALNSSLANFLKHELPDLLKREALRSRSMKPGEFVPQTRETAFALFVANCCMDKDFDSKRYYDTTGRELYLTNTALTTGVEITDARIAVYRAAREGDKKPFLAISPSPSPSPSPRQQARDSVFTTSGFCCVSVDDNKNLVGMCQKCMKKMGWNCPSVLNVRCRLDGFSDHEDPRSLMGVYSAGIAKRNGNSQSEFLSGKAKARTKKKSTLMHDPASWLAHRTNDFLYEACLGLMILPKREAGAINPSKFKQRPELIAQLVALANDPQEFRKNQEHQRSSADREMGAYGYSDFTSVQLYEQMDEQKKDKLGRLKTNKEEDDISCDSAEEGFAETKDNSGKSALPFTITQEDTQVDDEL